MAKIDKTYHDLLEKIMNEGVRKEGRNGPTRSIFGVSLEHDMEDGFPLLTTKKMHWKGIVSELLWFLRGRTDLRWLLERNNKIWVGDAYRVYSNKCSQNKDNYTQWMFEKDDGSFRMYTKEEFIQKVLTDDNFSALWGNLGDIYGSQWRNWDHQDWFGMEGLDQVKSLIYLLNNNPDSRRMLVTAWNPTDIDDLILPACHYSFQVWTRELSYDERVALITSPENYESIVSEDYLNTMGAPNREISMVWNQRSGDTPLGIPYNIASYALLLKLLAHEVNMVPGKLRANIGDAHIYENQIPGIQEQLKRDVTKYDSPYITIDRSISIYNPDAERFPVMGNFNLHNYNSYPSIKIPLSN